MLYVISYFYYENLFEEELLNKQIIIMIIQILCCHFRFMKNILIQMLLNIYL